MLIQKLLIQYILLPLARIVERIPEKMRDRMFVAAGVGIGIQAMWNNTSLPMYRYMMIYIVGCLLLGIMILCTLSTKMKPIRFRWPIMACWLGVGIMVLQSALRLNSNYLTEAVMFLFAFPIVFVCWNNAEREKVFRLLLKIIKITGVIAMIACLLFARITENHYSGVFCQHNGMAFFLITVVVCVFVEILYAERLDWRCGADILILGCSVAMCYYTNSRTGYLSMICAAFFSVGMYMLTHNWKENGKCLIRLTASALVVLLCVFNLVYVFQWRAQINLPFYNPRTATIYYAEQTGSTFFCAENSESVNSGISSFRDAAQKDGKTEGKSLDAISTGRITLWKAYGRDLNLFGHARVPWVRLERYDQMIGTTHMTVLEFAYESGIFAGVFYLLLNLLSGVLTIWFAWKYRREKYALMPLAVTVAFGVVSVLASCALTFAYIITFCYYCVLFPVMVYPNERADEME